MVQSNLWAKKSDKNGFYWLPLNQHLEDISQVSGLLFEHWLSEGVKELLIKSIDKGTYEIAKNIAMFLGATHDIGKCTPNFQIQRGFNSSDLDIALLENLEISGFVGITTFETAISFHHTILGQAILENYGVNKCITSIIGSHHGKPIDSDIKNHIISYKKNYYQSENKIDKIYKFWESQQRSILKRALENANFDSVENLPLISQPGQVILSGLLIMADWIASNEKYFPLIPIDENEVIDKKQRLINGWRKWFKEFYLWNPKYEFTPEIYSDRFGFEPNDLQNKIMELIDNILNPGIIILEAPMGIGKTEAALVAVEQMAYKTGKSGLFFGLPTQATSDGIFPRINSWLKSLDSDNDTPQSLRLVHGKAALNEEFSNLPRSSNIYDERIQNSSVVVNEWFSGRKVAIMDSFTVGTVDQFLLLSLKQKHLALRHLGFSRKVVVIDEVHAYDAYMSVYLMESLRWMAAYNVPVIILSATLPVSKRNELIENYMRGQGRKYNSLPKPLNFENNHSYPLITYNDGEQILQYSSFSPVLGKDVHIEKIKSSKEEYIYELVKNLIKDGGVVGIIVNTVKKSQKIAKLFNEIFGEEIVELLHSAFIATDRIAKEKELLKTIGKNGNRPNKKIIIGTQVIEQSLDIDFDVIISDLAPMDLLIQRMGRLHRHNIERRDIHKIPRFYVLGSGDYNLDEGSEAVYGGYLLYRTEYYLPDILNLPNDISPLVQNVYSNIPLDLEKENEEIYKKYKVENEIKLENKKIKAETYKIPNPSEKISNRKTISNWISNLNIEANKSDEKAYAQVRDSGDTIEVIALKKLGEGYSLINAPNKVLDLTVEGTSMEISKHTLKLPNALCKEYNIDKTIEELEKFNDKYLTYWRADPWLKGSLGIIFDENNQFRLNGFLLTYDRKYGLMYEKESENGKI